MSFYKHFINRGHAGFYAALVPLFLAGVCCFFLKPVSAETRAERIQLASEEQELLREHPVIRLAPEFGYAVFTGAPIANAQTLPTVKRQIVAGGDYNYPPYEWIDEHGQPAGFNVDLMRAIAEAMGWEVTFQLGTWDEVRRELAAGKIDVLPMYSSEERFDVVDFTDPFEMIYYEVFTRRDSPPVRSLDEIRGLEVIVQRDALMHDHLKQNDRGARLVLVESEPEALRLLASGRHSCAIVSRIGGLFAIDRLKLTNIATSGPPLLPRGYALAVKKGNIQLRDELNQGLSIIKKTGRHEEISRKWFGEMEPPRITLWSMLRYAVWIVVPLIFLSAAAFVWAEMLKKKIAQKTLMLGIELDERKKAENALRNSEEKFRMLVDYSIQGILLIQADRITYVNPALCKITGLSYEEALALTMAQHFELVHPDDRALVIERQTLFQRGEPIDEVNELRIIRKDGEIRWVQAATKSFTFQGKPARLGMMVDITDRKHAEEELEKYREHLEELVVERTVDLERSQQALQVLLEDMNEAKKELEIANERLKELDQLKSMFIASMSHELRTPLNSIIGFSSVLLKEWKGLINEEQREYLSIILRSGKHLLVLINDVIDISKIEARTLEIRYEDFDLHNVIMEAVSSLEKNIKDKGLELSVESIHMNMHTDRRRLLQCALNLLSNAMKFTERGTVRVTARLVRSKEVGGVMTEKDSELRTPGSGLNDNFDYIEIVVEDTGIGIREEDMPKLFQAFGRLDSPLRATVLGTGLGLYLTKKLVTEALKGEIRAESIHEKGSKFTIKIPTRVNSE